MIHSSFFKVIQRSFFFFLIFSCTSYVSIAQHLKKDGTPDRRYKENKSTYSSPSPSYSKPDKTYNEPNYSGTHYKKDGTPDMRYKENKTNYTAPTPKYSTPALSGGHYKADGTPDRRYKENNSGYVRERDSKGRYVRSSAAKTAFKKQTGYPHGRPGYVIDHIIPLKKGGCDCPENMQWQTVEDAKAKDKWEMP